jgi:ribokinase
MSSIRPRIVVVGSANVDMIVRSTRLPRPGETVSGSDLITAGGGKGANQAIAAQRLGADVAFVARVGGDALGQFVVTTLEDEGLDHRHVTVDSSAPTGVALILVDENGQNMISLSPGANARLTPADVRAAEAAFRDVDVLITQHEVPVETVRTALELGRTHRATTVLNPAPARPIPSEFFALVDWLTPNEVEAAALVGHSVDDVASAGVAARELRTRGAANVVVTLGARGAVYLTDGDALYVPARAVHAVDATAAGDAFTAGLAVALARHVAPGAAVDYASACGALATTRAGAQPALPREADVAAFLAQSPLARGSR